MRAGAGFRRLYTSTNGRGALREPVTRRPSMDGPTTYKNEAGWTIHRSSELRSGRRLACGPLGCIGNAQPPSGGWAARAELITAFGTASPGHRLPVANSLRRPNGHGYLAGCCPVCGFAADASRKATGQARWGTGVWMSAGRRAGEERRDPVMTVAASTAAKPNAAAQIQLIWPKLDWNCAGSV